MKHAIILAAGGSTRLGHPKQLIRWGDGNLLTHVIQTIAAAGVEQIAVVVGAHQDAIIASVNTDEYPPVRWLRNEDWRDGQSTSLRLAIHELQSQWSEHDAILIALCDQPAIDTEHYAALIDTVISGDFASSATQYPSGAGVPACFSAAILRLLELHGDQGAKNWLRTQPPDKVHLLQCPAAACDIDSPQDEIHLRRRSLRSGQG
ncbi:nucleotidyltransferase family protein [Novipirellula caenicola]|uniref:Bifunctional protein GlmU n=1 Tax=Novipirellula caenicola TaxID=1536901 RepID=A0ABP9W0J4_9BACT